MPPPPRSTLFPYTTLFRSLQFTGEGATPAQAGSRLASRADSLRRALATLGIPRDPLVNRSRWYWRSEEHTSELQSLRHLVCRLLLEKKKKEDVDMKVPKAS